MSHITICEPMKEMGVKNLNCLAPEKYPEVCINCSLPTCVLDNDRSKEKIRKITEVYHLRTKRGYEMPLIAHTLGISLRMVCFYWSKRGVLNEASPVK